MKTKLLIGLGALSLLGGYTATQLGAEPTYEVISWDKPTTDAAWAEESKKEAFDFRRTPVLEQMLESHSAKLEREIQAFKKYEDCPECIYYEFYEQFIASEYTESEAQAEASKQRDEAIASRRWSIEKLRQSVERMEKELELRAKGYLIVAEEEGLLGSSVPPERIRHVHD